MKKKPTTSNLVTKNYLKGELKSFEDRLDKKIDTLEKMLNLEIVSSILDARQRLEKKFSEAIDKIFTRIDPLLGEIPTAREDRTITTYRLTKLQETVSNHEERLKEIEAPKSA